MLLRCGGKLQNPVFYAPSLCYNDSTRMFLSEKRLLLIYFSHVTARKAFIMRLLYKRTKYKDLKKNEVSKKKLYKIHLLLKEYLGI